MTIDNTVLATDADALGAHLRSGEAVAAEPDPEPETHRDPEPETHRDPEPETHRDPEDDSSK